MKPEHMALLLNVGGPILIAHIALLSYLRMLIGWKSELAAELFTGTRGAPHPYFGLLRLKYLLPWLPHPNGIAHARGNVRLVFRLARLTGIISVAVLLTYMAGIISVAIHAA